MRVRLLAVLATVHGIFGTHDQEKGTSSFDDQNSEITSGPDLVMEKSAKCGQWCRRKSAKYVET